MFRRIRYQPAIYFRQAPSRADPLVRSRPPGRLFAVCRTLRSWGEVRDVGVPPEPRGSPRVHPMSYAASAVCEKYAALGFSLRSPVVTPAVSSLYSHFGPLRPPRFSPLARYRVGGDSVAGTGRPIPIRGAQMHKSRIKSFTLEPARTQTSRDRQSYMASRTWRLRQFKSGCCL
jgi:hypothetical protein